MRLSWPLSPAAVAPCCCSHVWTLRAAEWCRSVQTGNQNNKILNTHSNLKLSAGQIQQLSITSHHITQQETWCLKLRKSICEWSSSCFLILHFTYDVHVLSMLSLSFLCFILKISCLTPAPLCSPLLISTCPALMCLCSIVLLYAVHSLCLIVYDQFEDTQIVINGIIIKVVFSVDSLLLFF